MAGISAFNSKDSLIKKPSGKRRTRGPRPRGPQPQVCDLCQIRKVKCDKTLPRCSLCQKVNKPCTYDRLGFSTSSSLNLTKDQRQSYIRSKDQITNKLLLVSDDSIQRDDDYADNCDYECIQNNLMKRNPTKFLKFATLDNMLKSLLVSLLMQAGQSQLYTNSNGDYYYTGPSLATYYFATNSRLFLPVLGSAVTNYSPLVYNKTIQVTITKTLILQLVELYFGYLNSFIPLIDAPSFYSKLHQGNHDDPFLALLSVVCLSGTSYYPNRTIGRIIAAVFSKRVKHYLKNIYLKPSLTSIQAFLLASYHISLCEDDPVILKTGFYLNIAKRMLETMGLPLKPSAKEAFKHQVLVRVYWVVFCAQALIATCLGIPILSTGNEVALPKAEFSVSSVNFSYPSIFIIKEIITLKPEFNAQFFLEFCLYCKFLGHRLDLTSFYGSRPEPHISKHSLESILSDGETLPQRSTYFKKMKELETISIQHFLKMPKFQTINYDRDGLTLPDPLDIHYSQLSTYYFSLLVDVNKPFIDPKQLVRNMPMKSRSLPLEQYHSASPLERVVLATFYGCQIFIDMKRWYGEVGIPYIWYCAVQFSFVFLYLVKILDKSHWAHAPAKRNALFLIGLLEKNSDRWAVIRDSYFILKPFGDALEKSC